MKNPYVLLIGSTSIAQLFLFAISPIITRIYTPGDVGAFGVVLSISAFLASISTCRLEHALPIAKNRITSIQVSFLAFIFISSFTMLFSSALLLIYFSNALDDKTWTDLPLFLIPAICFFLALFNLLNSLLVRQKQFQKIGEIKLYQGFLTGIFQLLLHLVLNGALALSLGHVFGYLFGGIIALKKVCKEFLVVFLLRRLNIKDTLLTHQKYPLLFAPAAIFNQASQHIPTLAIGYIFGLYSAGLYVFVLKICNVPLAILGQAVSQVYASEIKTYLYSSDKNLLSAYIQLLLRLSLCGGFAVIVMVSIVFFGSDQFFGDTWSNMGIVAILLSPMFFADFVSTPVSMTLSYLDKQNQQLKWDFFRCFSIFFFFLFVFIFELSHGKALLCFSILWFLYATIHVYLSYKACSIHSASFKKYTK